MSVPLIRKTIPVIITFLAGMLMIGQWFLNIATIDQVANSLQSWGVVLSAFALGLGSVNIIVRNVRRIQRREGTDWLYAIWLLFVFFLFISIGIGFGSNSSQYRYIFNTILQPLSGTMYPATLFFLASGIYRTFRARTTQALIFVISGSFMLLANAPVSGAFLPFTSPLKAWIMDVEVTAVYRAILIGIGLGTIMLGFRVLFGLETTHLGREEARREVLG
jgi:hypothetical protein